MRKYLLILFCGIALSACDKHDPILPGVRTAIFDSVHVDVLNKTISNIPETAHTIDNSNCPYTQDAEAALTEIRDMQPVLDVKFVKPF